MRKQMDSQREARIGRDVRNLLLPEDFYAMKIDPVDSKVAVVVASLMNGDEARFYHVNGVTRLVDDRIR